MRTVTADQLIQLIAEILAEASGEHLEEIANQVLSQNVKYAEDGFFELQ